MFVMRNSMTVVGFNALHDLFAKQVLLVSCSSVVRS